MEKTDLVKQHKAYYTAKKTPALVNTGKASFLSIDGKGDPSGTEFARRVQALYVAAYAVKFHSKSLGRDFVVAKLEALWWFDEKKYGKYSMAEAPVKIPREQWFYKLLIRIPGHVSEEETQRCIRQVRAKKELTDLNDVKQITLDEGDCVQVLHVGPFDKEPETLELLNKYMLAKKLGKNGHHHEIYLSDFRKTSPEKLRTILREPVKPIAQ